LEPPVPSFVKKAADKIKSILYGNASIFATSQWTAATKWHQCQSIPIASVPVVYDAVRPSRHLNPEFVL
jgi:hypothetical protein